jgi:hypothetical protein
MHLDDERIERWMHGEMAPDTERSAREHLAACAECRARLAEAQREEREVHALLRGLDAPAPRVDARAVIERARPRGAGWARRAAAIAIAVGIAGAAYAVPGSPLRAFVVAVVERLGGGAERAPEPRRRAPESAPPPAPAPAPGAGGIAVAAGSNLVIAFTSTQPDGVARVSLVEGADVVVRAPTGAATFTSDADRLTIDNADGAADFEIAIPHDAPRVEIQVDGRRLLVKEGPRMITSMPYDPRGLYILPLWATGP